MRRTAPTITGGTLALQSSRMALLALVARGQVYSEIGQYWRRDTECRVTFAVATLITAGWVACAPSPVGKTPARILGAGRHALNLSHRCGTCGSACPEGLPAAVCQHATASMSMCLDRGCRTWDVCAACWSKLIKKLEVNDHGR